VNTVRDILLRYKKNNYQVILARRNNECAASRIKLTDELRKYLGSTETLDRWKGLPLRDRCLKLMSEKGVKLAHSTLRTFYVANGIKWTAASKRKRHKQTEEWLERKYQFCYKLAEVIFKGMPLLYFDETSVNSWLSLNKTWHRPEDDIYVEHPT
jgi:hypothetical protein